MRSLDGPDLFHLAQERPGRPMHTLKVAVLGRHVPCEHIDAWALERLVQVEPLRSQLRSAPLSQPVWVDAEEIDLEYHVQHVTLPAPGDERDFCAFLSRLCGGASLDRRRPLWRLWHVVGLADNRDALVFQVHHAVADGNASVALWNALADQAPPPALEDEDAGSLLPRVLMAATLQRGARQAARLPNQFLRFGSYVQHTKENQRAGEHVVTKAFLGPSTRFNGDPEADRRCTFATISLERLRAVRKATGATVTEIFATISGGAVREFLERVDEPPDAALTATVPAALPERTNRFGNSVTTLYASLHSDILDPLDRLPAVQESLAASREATDRDPRLLADWQQYPRLNAGTIRLMELSERRTGRPAYNLTLSSVRGPETFALAGAPVVDLRSIGPLVGRFGLNLTAWSYGDDFTVGIHAYASAGDRLEELGPLLLDELADLEQHVARTPQGAS